MIANRYQHCPAQAKFSFVHNLELSQYLVAKSSGHSLLLSLPLSIEVLPVGIIAGATIGVGILVIFFFVALVFFLYRRRKGSEYRRFTATTNPSGSHHRVGARSQCHRDQQKAPGLATPPCPRSKGCDLEEARHQGRDGESGATHDAFRPGR